MKKIFLFALSFSILFSCSTKNVALKTTSTSKTEFTIAFGSCNKQYKTNILWKEIIKNNPNLWIWGGDNVYADTYNMDELKQHYKTQINQKGYQKLLNTTPVLATWDDHDYGVNDTGYEFEKKRNLNNYF